MVEQAACLTPRQRGGLGPLTFPRTPMTLLATSPWALGDTQDLSYVGALKPLKKPKFKTNWDKVLPAWAETRKKFLLPPVGP